MNQPAMDMKARAGSLLPPHRREAPDSAVGADGCARAREAGSPCVPAIWRYDEVRPWLMESGQLISAEEAVRRVLILENPGMPGSSAITQSLYAGLQLILPGEVAPSHRHYAVGAAPHRRRQRCLYRGRGRADHHASRRFHHHAIVDLARSRQPRERSGGVARRAGYSRWCVFSTAGSQRTIPRPRSRLHARRATRWRATAPISCPVDYEPRQLASPVFAYPYARTRETLAQLARNGAPHAAHGHKMQFVNPATGGYRHAHRSLLSCSCCRRGLREGTIAARTAPCSTSSKVPGGQ